jgi:hypothetical protein
MILGTVTQQPAERLDYDIDYAEQDFLTAGETISSATAAVTPAGLSVALVNVSTRVKLWVEGGSAGTTYKVTVTATTSDGRIKQDELKVRIKDF